MIESLFKYTFMKNAFIASVLTGIVCGIIGTVIVEKKLVSMSGGIAHASFGGIGFGYLVGIEPIIGGLIFAILSSLGITTISRKTNTNSDSLIGIFWAVGMSLGILFISLMPGYPPDMTSYLFGDILTVSSVYIKIIGILSLIILLSISMFFNYWKSYLFDEEFAKVLGIETLIFEYFLFVLIALSIVILIKVVGIILSIALLTIPPAIAKLLNHNLKSIMIMSSLLGIIFNIMGLIISYQYNIPSGSTIILLSVTGYCLVVVISKMLNKYKSGNNES